MELTEYISHIEKNELKEVDLSPYGLELIPAEIFKFSWIEKLILGMFLNYKDYKFEGKRTCELKYLQEELTELTNLKSLAISGGLFGTSKPQYTNFDILGKLSSLESLYIESTHLTHLNFLEQLVNLKDLQLSFTEIIDYKPLENCTQLRSLTIGDNELTNIDFLKEFKNLEALSITTNEITSLDSIKNNTKIKRLCVCKNPIEDYKALMKFTDLQYFCNGGKQSIEILSNNKNLVEFEPQEIDQYGINKLSEFNQLNTVHIWNFVGDEIDVSNLTSVENLQIYGEFKVVNGLENLKNLKSLHLSSKELGGLKIPYLETLVKIGIPGCPIDNFDFYPDFNNVEELDIGSTQINTLQPLEEIRKLKRLNCYNTLISSLKPILHLIKEDFDINFEGDNVPRKLQVYYDKNSNEGILNYYKEYDK
ncbi:MAG TPA: hypothetical protein VK169_00805 [Saprospiraceae bacterium]|nr:hypothetical protein [Saprospiraceae bacterium]